MELTTLHKGCTGVCKTATEKKCQTNKPERYQLLADMAGVRCGYELAELHYTHWCNEKPPFGDHAGDKRRLTFHELAEFYCGSWRLQPIASGTFRANLHDLHKGYRSIFSKKWPEGKDLCKITFEAAWACATLNKNTASLHAKLVLHISMRDSPPSL